MRYAVVLANHRILEIMRDFDQYNATYTACPAHSQFLINNKIKLTKNKTKLTFLSFKIY